MKIVTDEKILRQRCEPVATPEEGQEIANQLFEQLSHEPNGVGLAANQVGIQKRVCVINVKEPIYLVNPEIIDRDQEIQFTESCMSFPGKSIRTIRNIWVTVKSDNLGTNVFGPAHQYENITGNDDDVIECIAVQHEIDHLNGLTMFDKQMFPKEKNKKYSRNEIVTIEKNGEKKQLKFKKIEPFLSQGWKLNF